MFNGRQTHHSRQHAGKLRGVPVRPGDPRRRPLILSGQIGVGPDGNAIDDLEEQFARAFDLIGQILHEAGLSFDNIVDLHTFHVGLQANLGTFMKVKAKYITEPFPSWTAIGVVELALPGIAVEIKATAAYS